MFLEIIQRYIMDLLRNGINKTNIMKLKGELLNKTYKDIQDYDKLKSIPAISMYYGVSFKELNLDSVNSIFLFSKIFSSLISLLGENIIFIY